MKIKDKGYVLENKGLPICFLVFCAPDDDSLMIEGKYQVKGLKTAETIQEALFETQEEAIKLLRYYNDETFHREVPEFNIREVEITYEI